MCVPLKYNKNTCITAFLPNSKLNKAQSCKPVRRQVLGSIGSLATSPEKESDFGHKGPKLIHVEATQIKYYYPKKLTHNSSLKPWQWCVPWRFKAWHRPLLRIWHSNSLLTFRHMHGWCIPDMSVLMSIGEFKATWVNVVLAGKTAST
jgi:hypothetical protein